MYVAESTFTNFADVQDFTAILNSVVKVQHPLIATCSWIDPVSHVESLITSLVLLAVHGLWYLLSRIWISVQKFEL